MNDLIEQSFPIIKDGENEFYGGSQDWYPVEWMRHAGCASVIGADLSAYYETQLNQSSNVFDQRAFLMRQFEMYKYMTPGIHGFPDPQKFIDRFVIYEHDHGYEVRGHLYSGWRSIEEAENYIEASLNKAQPVAMLVLHHKALSMEENNWHWMVITCYDRVHRMIFISNYAKKESYKVQDVFEPAKENEVWLLNFEAVK